MRRILYISFLLAALATALLPAGCGNGTKSATAGTVNVQISDPATCAAPQGQFSHVYVTITDVLIHQSAAAAANDAGWVDLTPNLKNAPMQVDLLGLATNQCFLATLGSAGIQPGTYQQIRVMLAENNTSVSGNKCVNPTSNTAVAANCVMLTSDTTNTPHPLLLSSEAQTGIKIPSGQIAGGQFTIAAGQTKDLNIDFNACASIVMMGNGQFRLKPVLHAGEVSLTSVSISGTAVDSVTHQPVVGGAAVAALEQKEQSTGVDRVIMETLVSANGSFAFCPVPAGIYDVVVTAIDGTGKSYAATVITGVQPGNSLGNVPLTAAALPAGIHGQTTTTTGSAATAADLTLSTLQPITVNSAAVLITVPLPQFPAATATLVTAPGACPANTDCVNYALSVPAANPSVGAFVTTGTQTPAPPPAGTVNYTMDALAFVPGQAGAADCTPSHLQTSLTSASAPLTVTAGTPVTAATLAFTGCH